MRRRFGISLVEVLVVLAIIGLFLGLVLPAAMNIRRQALQTQALNQLRQLSLATQNYIASHNGRMPPAGNIKGTDSFHTALLPFVDAQYQASYSSPLGNGKQLKMYQVFISPIDPGIAYYSDDPGRSKGNASFAANAVVFKPRCQIEHITDGASNTITLVERYARCRHVDVNFSLNNVECFTEDGAPLKPCPMGGTRMATFADDTYYDAKPVSQNGATRCSKPGVTFQAAVAPNMCDPLQIQAAYSKGLMTAFADGSVRLISPTVSESTFWSQVTPNGGEWISTP